MNNLIIKEVSVGCYRLLPRSRLRHRLAAAALVDVALRWSSACPRRQKLVPGPRASSAPRQRRAQLTESSQPLAVMNPSTPIAKASPSLLFLETCPLTSATAFDSSSTIESLLRPRRDAVRVP
jgi:hypothetical protein